MPRGRGRGADGSGGWRGSRRDVLAASLLPALGLGGVSGAASVPADERPFAAVEASAVAAPASPSVPDCFAGAGTGLVLHATKPGDAAGTSPGLVVVDPAGREVRRIDLPPVTVGVPTRFPGRALVVAADGFYVVDARTGAARQVEESGQWALTLPWPVQFRESVGRRFWLVGAPDGSGAALVDLETGDVAPLGHLIDADVGGAVGVGFGAVAPDDGHVLFWTGQRIYLAATADPARLRRLGGGAATADPRFLDGGGSVLYTRTRGDGAEAVVERADGTVAEVVATIVGTNARIWAVPVPGAPRLAIGRTDRGGSRLALLDLATGQEREVGAFKDPLGTLEVAPSGRRAVVKAGTSWHLADLDAGTVAPLPDPGGYPASAVGRGARWVTFTPFSNHDRYAGLDLETGELGPTLRQEPRADRLYVFAAGVDSSAPPDFTPDGRYGLLRQRDRGPGTERWRLWVLDNAAGTSRSMAEAASIDTALSPDGCWVAVGSTDRPDREGRASLDLFPIAGGEPIRIEGGYRPTWVGV